MKETPLPQVGGYFAVNEKNIPTQELDDTKNIVCPEHTGLNDLHCISFLTLVASGSTRVSNEAKFLWEVKF